MGLLDIFNPQDDASRQSLIALSAGLLQPTRGGFGQSLSNGLMGYANARQMYDQRVREKEQADVQMGMNKAHMSLYQQQAEASKQKAISDQQLAALQQAWRDKWMTPKAPEFTAGQAALATGAGAPRPSIGPTMDNAQRQAAFLPMAQRDAQNPMAGITPQALFEGIQAKVPGIDALLKLHEAQNSFSPLQPGWNVNKLTGEREFTGKYAEGQMPGPGGSMVPQPGAIGTISAIEAAKAAATEQGKQSAAHGFNRMQVTNPDGSMSETWTADQMGTPPGMRGQQQLPPGQGRPMPMPTPMQPRPSVGAPARSGGPATPENPYVSPGQQAGMDTQARALKEQELNAAAERKDWAQVARIQRELEASPAGAQPSQPMQPSVAGPVVKPSPMVEKRGTAVLDADKTRLEGANKVAADMQSTLATLDAIERQMKAPGSGGSDKGGVYQGGIGDRFATFAQTSGLNSTLGRSDPKAVRTRALLQAGEQLVVGSGLGGQVSNADAARYEKARGDFNKAQDDASRYEAIQTMREIASRAMQNANQLRSGIGSGQGAPDYQAPVAKTGWKQHYDSEAAAVQDAKNAIMRAPTKRREIIQRLEQMGVTNHGMTK